MFLPGSKRKHAFTLIELLIAITIIAILIGVGTVSWTKSQEKARDGKRKSDLKTIQQALEDYFRVNLYYPAAPATSTWCKVINSSTTPAAKDALVPAYLQQLPTDPSAGNQSDTSGDYLYKKLDRNKYELYAKLESQTDPDRTGPDSPCAGYSGYNYKVTSP